MAQRNKQTNSVRLNPSPEYDDPRALLEHGIRGMVRLSRSEDGRVAREARAWLERYVEKLAAAEPAAAKAVAELKALWAREWAEKGTARREGAEGSPCRAGVSGRLAGAHAQGDWRA